jgi:hypothetical protein
MTLYPNQFEQTVVKGKLDLSYNPNTIACEVDSSQSTALVAGQPVKLVDSVGGVPKVVAVAADTEVPFGFVNFNLKDREFAAYKPVEISHILNIMYMEASAAIARGATVAVVVSGQKVVTWTTGQAKIGIALDKAVNVGDLIRVEILAPLL